MSIINVGGKYGKRSKKRYGDVINPATIFQGMRRSGNPANIQRVGIGVWEGILEPSYQYAPKKQNFKGIAKNTYQDDLYIEDKQGASFLDRNRTRYKLILTFNKEEVQRKIGSVEFLTQIITSNYQVVHGGTMYSNANTYEFQSAIFEGTPADAKRAAEGFQRTLRGYGVGVRVRIQEFRG
jgi:hypothetical protein